MQLANRGSDGWREYVCERERERKSMHEDCRLKFKIVNSTRNMNALLLKFYKIMPVYQYARFEQI